MPLLTYKEHFLSCYPQEGCGILVDNLFIPLENTHSNPARFFALSEKDSYNIAKMSDSDKGVVLLHSHTHQSFTNDPRTPSYEDMQGRKVTGMPWGIVHCDGQDVSDILMFGHINEEPLLGRKYLSNIFDCFTLARDYYWRFRSLDLGLHPRPENWEEWNPYYIEKNYIAAGFKQVFGEYEVGDVLLFTIASSKINHIGIYTAEDTFIHHLYNHVSCEDSLIRWRKQVTKVIRHYL